MRNKNVVTFFTKYFNARTNGILEMEEQNVDEDEVLKQESRAFLRERFLRVISALQGREATFQMFGNVRVEGEFGGIGIDFQDVFVKKLKTPMGILNSALLRSTDIISINISLGVDE